MDHLGLTLFQLSAFCKCVFLFLSLDMGSCDVLFISYISADSLLQLALIKVNDVQTLIINCAAYLLFSTGSFLSKGKILYMLVGGH